MTHENANGNKSNELQRPKKVRTGQRTVSPDKPSINPFSDNPPKVDADLADIIQAWPFIPDQIKVAVRAIVTPYLTGEDDNG